MRTAKTLQIQALLLRINNRIASHPNHRFRNFHRSEEHHRLLDLINQRLSTIREALNLHPMPRKRTVNRREHGIQRVIVRILDASSDAILHLLLLHSQEIKAHHVTLQLSDQSQGLAILSASHALGGLFNPRSDALAVSDIQQAGSGKLEIYGFKDRLWVDVRLIPHSRTSVYCRLVCNGNRPHYHLRL